MIDSKLNQYKCLLRALMFVTAAALPLSAANAGLIVDLEDATNGGGFFAGLELQNTNPNTVGVTLDIQDPINDGLSKGDILGFFFNINGMFADLAATNFNPAESNQGLTVFMSPSDSLGGNNNLNGTGFTFDVGVTTGVQGGKQGSGFIQLITFDLTGTGLTTAAFGEDFGLRVQSIEGTSSFSSGSAKLIGSGTPDPTPVSSPGSLPLLAAGMLGFIPLAMRRRRKQKA